MKFKFDFKKIIKLNIFYLVYQLIFFSLGYLGFYDMLIKNCYGISFCNLDVVLFLQGILNLLFILQARTNIANLTYTIERFGNMLLFCAVPIILINYFLYIITYPKYILPLVLGIADTLFFGIILLMSINYKSLSKKLRKTNKK